MEKIKFPAAVPEKIDIKYLSDEELERILGEFEKIEKDIEVSQPNMGRNTFFGQIKNTVYEASLAFPEEDGGEPRYDITVYRKNKDGSSTMIAGSPPYEDSEAIKNFYVYLRNLYYKKRKDTKTGNIEIE